MTLVFRLKVLYWCLFLCCHYYSWSSGSLPYAIAVTFTLISMTLVFCFWIYLLNYSKIFLSKRWNLTVTSCIFFKNCSRQVDQSPDFLHGIQGLHDLWLAFVSDFTSKYTCPCSHTWLAIISKIQCTKLMHTHVH